MLIKYRRIIIAFGGNIFQVKAFCKSWVKQPKPVHFNNKMIYLRIQVDLYMCACISHVAKIHGFVCFGNSNIMSISKGSEYQ